MDSPRIKNVENFESENEILKIFQNFSNFCLEWDEFRKDLDLEPENDESLDAELWAFDEGFPLPWIWIFSFVWFFRNFRPDSSIFDESNFF